MAEGPVVLNTTNAWKYVQSGVEAAFNFYTPEVKELQNLRSENQPYSFRANEIILDLNADGGIATIGEGDFEAEEGSTDLEKGTLNISHFIGRFNLSNLAKYADQGNSNQLERDLTWRGMKKVQAMGAHIGDYFYGSSSGVLALTDVNVTTQTTLTLTLYAGYGNTGITNGDYIARKFAPQVNGKGGDVVALVNGSSLVASSFARVTARNLTAGTITVSVISGSVTVNATGLKVVKANSKGRLTVAHTDFNRGLSGFQDILFATAYHGLTHPNWTPAYTSSTSGRATFADFILADDSISNFGAQDVKGDRVYIDQRVYADMIAYERAGLRYANAGNLSVDGKISSEDRKFIRSRRVPPGWMVVTNKNGLKKWEIMNSAEGNGPGWGEGKEYIDLSGRVFRVERVMGLVVPNRQLWAVFTNKTRAAS